MQRSQTGSMVLVLALMLSACVNVPEDAEFGGQSTPVEVTAAMPVTGEDTSVPNSTQPEGPSDATATAEHDLVAAYPNLLSELGAYALENENGENLGSVEGFVLDRADGDLVYVAASVGGVLGISQQVMLLPYTGLKIAGLDAFQRTEPGPTTEPAAQDDLFRGVFVISGLSADDLATAPGFTAGELPAAASRPGWDGAAQAYWSGRADLPEIGAAPDGPNPVYLEQALDLNARSANGQTVGEIADLVIDPAAGRLTHLLLVPDAGLALDRGVFVLPFAAVEWQVGEDGEHWIVLDAAQLADAPVLEAVEDLPDTTQDNWDAEIRP